MTVVDLFERCVAAHPRRTAVVADADSLSYGELNARANRLANRLHGLGAQDPVGICLPRRIDTVVALLGVLKAGGACLPLDPDYPPKRLSAMIRDTRARFLVTCEELLGTFTGVDARPVLLTAGGPAAGDGDNPRTAVSPHDLAYILYTSGSSGMPKGVEIEHHALRDNATKTAALFELTPADAVFQFASPSFVSSIGQIFAPLVMGARVVLRGRQHSTAQYVRYIAETGVSVLWLTPSMIKSLTARADASIGRLGPPLRLLRSGGESLTAEVVRHWFAQSSVPLLNVYGPTEGVQDIAAVKLTEAPPVVTIGRPLFDAEIFLLDQVGDPVPAGDPGELFFASSGMARGYLRRPELTGERFVQRFVEGRARRLYRTGDIARQLPDAQFEFLGRRDRQVKLRGYRIEPAEIEACLVAHPGVMDAAVVAVATEGGDKRLVAYYVRCADAELDQRALLDWCSRSLPAHSVPTKYQPVDVLPLTPNGKLDRIGLSHRTG